MLTRRTFLRTTGLSLAAYFAPGPLGRTARAGAAGDRIVVALFLRGGADGLNLVVPRGDGARYAALRPTLALPAQGTVPLDGFFDLHGALAPLAARFAAGELAVVHAVGGTRSYSHFLASDAMELVKPEDPRGVDDGWLHRAMTRLPAAPIPALTGVSLDSVLRTSLAGTDADLSVTFGEIGEFVSVGGFAEERLALLDAIYEASESPLLRRAGGEVADAVAALGGVAGRPPDDDYDGVEQRFAARLQDAARLVKGDVGVRAIALDLAGWDTHTEQESTFQVQGRTLARGLDAFYRDLGPAASRTLTLVMTEFGRTAAGNGNLGTDHGWGSVMLALGGGIAGGRVLCRPDPGDPAGGMPTPSGRWAGLAPERLHVSNGNPRDLAATTDYRDVFGEVLDRFLGIPAAAVPGVLRGYTPKFLGLFA